MRKPTPKPRLVFTIGHSTRARKDFLEILRAHRVRELVDVRTIPRSRHNPQFNSAELARALRRADIRYEHMAELGGLRRARPDSVNMAWRNVSFRGFADYMQTPDFRSAIDSLARLARQRRVAVMCAEAVPWRCHRSLIADALVVRDFAVEDIESVTRTRPHRQTPWARVRGLRIDYPAPLQTPSPEGGRQRS